MAIDSTAPAKGRGYVTLILMSGEPDKMSIAEILKSGVRRHLKKVAAFPYFTQEEEALLAARIKQGDEAAREQLAGAHLRDVIAMAHEFIARPPHSIDDLVRVGFVGLTAAINSFDPSRGCEFRIYALFFIKRALVDADSGDRGS